MIEGLFESLTVEMRAHACRYAVGPRAARAAKRIASTKSVRIIIMFVGAAYLSTRCHISYADMVHGIVAITATTPKSINLRRHARKTINDTTLILHTNRTNRNPSSVLNSIPLTSGDGSEFGHHRAEIIALEFRMVSVSGGLPGRAPDVWREGAQTKRSEL